MSSWSMSDGTSGSIAMSETTPCDMTILPYMERECSFAGTLPEISERDLRDDNSGVCQSNST